MANPFQIAGGTFSGAGTTRTYSVTNATAAGDTLLLIITVNNTSLTVSSVTDTQGNVYTADPAFTSATPVLIAYRSPGATGGSGGGQTAALTTSDHFTVTTSATSANVDAAGVCAPAVGALDQNPSVATGSSTAPSVSATPGHDNEICVVYGCHKQAGGAISWGGSVTGLAGFQTGSDAYVDDGYQILGAGTSGSPQTFSGTITSTNWRLGVWTFQAGAGSTPKSGADTASGVDTASLAAAIAGTDTATGADLAGVGVTGTDTGSGADTGTLAAHLTGADTAAGADTGTLAAHLTGTDTATGADLAGVGVSGADTGSGADTASVAVPIAAADTASGADTASVAVAVTGADTGSATETASTPGAPGCRADTDGSALGAGITATATSAQVDTTIPGAPLWTAAPGDWPFDIIVAGERITVTAVSGGASPQTFTLQRSVNSVVKAHAAGEPVALFQPCYFALA